MLCVCVCALRGPFVICAEPVDRLPVNQADKETDLAGRETDSRKAGKLDSRQFWPLFAAVKLCQTSFESGEAAETATIATTTNGTKRKFVGEK